MSIASKLHQTEVQTFEVLLHQQPYGSFSSLELNAPLLPLRTWCFSLLHQQHSGSQQYLDCYSLLSDSARVEIPLRQQPYGHMCNNEIQEDLCFHLYLPRKKHYAAHWYFFKKNMLWHCWIPKVIILPFFVQGNVPSYSIPLSEYVSAPEQIHHPIFQHKALFSQSFEHFCRSNSNITTIE